MEGIGGAIRGAIGATKLPALAKMLVSGAGTFASLTGVQELGYVASGDISGGRYAADIGISGLAGTAGAGVSRAITAVGATVLKTAGLLNNRLANTILAGLGGAAFAGGDTAVRTIDGYLEYGDKYQPDIKQTVKDVLIAFAFGTISYLASGQKGGAEKAPTEAREPSSEFFNADMTPEEMKAAYRRYTKQYHPDVNPDPTAAETMARINAEYEAWQKWNVSKAAQTGEAARAAKAEAESRGDTQAAAAADAEMQQAIMEITGYASDADGGILASAEAAEAAQILSAISGETAAPDVPMAPEVPEAPEQPSTLQPVQEAQPAPGQEAPTPVQETQPEVTAEVPAVKEAPEREARPEVEEEGKPLGRSDEDKARTAKQGYDAERRSLESQSEERRDFLAKKHAEHSEFLSGLEKGDQVYIDGSDEPAFEVREKTDDGMTLAFFDADGEVFTMERVLPDTFTGDTTYNTLEAAENVEVNKQAESDLAPRKEGSVSAENVKLSDLRRTFNDTQNTAYRVLTTYSKTFGVDIVLYASSLDASGEFTADNGRFQWKDDKIYIDINSGLFSTKDIKDLGRYTMLRTFGHEFSHFIEKWNPERYNGFREFVFDTMRYRGVNVEKMISDMQASDKSGKMTTDQASREVIAEAVSDILPDSKLVTKLARTQPATFKKLHKKLQVFRGRLKQVNT